MMTDDIARKKIFDMIENGDITADEGLRLLKALQSADENETSSASPLISESLDSLESSDTFDAESERHFASSSEEVQDMQFSHVKRWWVLPFGIGLFMTIMGAIWMYLGYEAKGFAWGFWLSWLPFILGAVIMVLSGLSSKAKWFHVRIREKHGENKVRISLSFPLPLKPTRWFLKTFGDRIPKTKGIPIDSIIDVIDNTVVGGEPFYVHVDDEDDEVEVFIG